MQNVKPFKIPKVSVVITCHNLGKYLKETIESVLNQNYKNFEIIVVNDCSNDDTREVMASFDNIKSINLEENLGQFGAFLEGLKEASGEFIVMLDADDVLLPDFLSVHIQVHMEKSIAFSSCAQFEIDDNSTIVCLNSLASPNFKNENFKSEIKSINEVFNLNRLGEKYEVEILDIKNCPFATWAWNPSSSAMMRKAPLLFLLKYKNYKKWMRGADKFIFSFLHLIGGSATISAPLIAYRRHSTNVSSTNPVFGNFRYLKPDTIKFYIGMNKIIRQETLKFIFENYKFFCEQFNHFAVKKMIFRIIFSFDKGTAKRILKSLFAR